MVLPKFVAAIATPGVGVGDCLVAGGKLRVLETIEFGAFGAAFPPSAVSQRKI